MGSIEESISPSSSVNHGTADAQATLLGEATTSFSRTKS
jgi:hypothetical protein